MKAVRAAVFHFAFLIFISTVTLAQSHAAAQAPAPVQTGPTEFTTSNGLKVIHHRVEGNEVIAVRLYFRGGVRNFGPQNAGIETLMLEVAQNGSKGFSKGVINRELAKMGTVIESSGGYDFSVLAMRCVRQHFGRSWEIFSDIVLNPLFEPQEVDLFKDQLVNALRQENDLADYVVALESNRLLFRSHPYSNSPTGTIESVTSLTAEKVRQYYSDHFQASRMLLVAGGNITLDDLKRKAETSFGKIPRGNYQEDVLPAFVKSDKPELRITDRQVATTYIRGVFVAPPLNHPDYPAMTIAINILQQLFFQEVRVKRNLSYGADATLLSQGANSGFISVTTAKPNETLRVMLDQIEFLERQVILPEGLKPIVGGFLTTYYTKLETNDAQIARFAEYELLGGGWKRALGWIDEVRKVTPEDVQRVSRTYLRNFRFAVVGSASQIDKTLFTSR
jgi:zinc protease